MNNNYIFLMTQGIYHENELSYKQFHDYYGKNSGNLLFIKSLHNIVKSNKIKYGLGGNIERINNEYNCIIIPSSNFINEQSDFSEIAHSIEKTKLNCLMVGLGAQSDSYATYPKIKKGTERFLKIVSERTNLIGVRGEYSADVLNEYGIKNVEIIGCPSLFYKLDENKKIYKKEKLDIHKIIFNGSMDVVNHSYSPIKMQKYEKNIFFNAFLNKNIYVFQSEIHEIEILDLLNNNKMPEKDRIKKIMYKWGIDLKYYLDFIVFLKEKCKVFYDIDKWEELINENDLVFGSRFHGSIIGVINNKPALVVAHDTRTQELLSLYKLPYISINNIINEGLSIEKMYYDADFSLFENMYKKLYSKTAEFFNINGIENNLKSIRRNNDCIELNQINFVTTNIDNRVEIVVAFDLLGVDIEQAKNIKKIYTTENNNCHILSLNSNPKLFFNCKLFKNKKYELIISMELKKDTILKIYWSKEDLFFSEENSKKVILNKDDFAADYKKITLKFNDNVDRIRIDPFNYKGVCLINMLQIIEV